MAFYGKEILITKARNYFSLFRVFVLSCFRDKKVLMVFSINSPSPEYPVRLGGLQG